jgi:hypothetical protein
MRQSVETGSDAMMHLPSFRKFGSDIKMLIRESASRPHKLTFAFLKARTWAKTD